MQCIWILDREFGQIKARIYAGTRFSSKDLPEEFIISKQPGSTIIPSGHPFEQYTPEKITEIYNFIQRTKPREFDK